MDSINQQRLGKLCQEFRIKHGYTQKEVADDLKLTSKAISHFENGRSPNLNILLWYVNKGLDLDGFYG